MSSGPFSPDANDATRSAQFAKALANRIARNEPPPKRNGPPQRYSGPPPLNAGKPRFYSGPPPTGQRIQDH